MGNPNRPRRLTRAEKIEQSRLEARKLKVFHAKPWWPVKANTEEEAIQLLVERMKTFIYDEELLKNPEFRKDFQLLGKVTEAKAFLASIPLEYMNKAHAVLEEQDRNFEARRQAKEDHFEYGDDLDYDEFKPYYPNLSTMTDEEIEKEYDIQCDRQGRAGDMDPINERMVEDALARCDSLDNERKKREISKELSSLSKGGIESGENEKYNLG